MLAEGSGRQDGGYKLLATSVNLADLVHQKLQTRDATACLILVNHALAGCGADLLHRVDERGVGGGLVAGLGSSTDLLDEGTHGAADAAVAQVTLLVLADTLLGGLVIGHGQNLSEGGTGCAEIRKSGKVAHSLRPRRPLRRSEDAHGLQGHAG